MGQELSACEMPTKFGAREICVPVRTFLRPALISCFRSGQIAGEFCGNDGIGGDPNALYQCDGNGGVSSCSNCPNGCVIEPSGTNDYCA